MSKIGSDTMSATLAAEKNLPIAAQQTPHVTRSRYTSKQEEIMTERLGKERDRPSTLRPGISRREAFRLPQRRMLHRCCQPPQMPLKGQRLQASITPIGVSS
jgi:hypothetical protein